MIEFYTILFCNSSLKQLALDVHSILLIVPAEYFQEKRTSRIDLLSTVKQGDNVLGIIRLPVRQRSPT